jgi:hypothetical protein
MFHVRRSLMTAALVVASATSALAQGTGSQGYFTIFNDTENNVVVGFYTNDGSGWSANWLGGVQIMPGQSGEAQFAADTGACDQVFAVGWLGSDGGEVVDEPISIDICAASNVYLNDNEIYYD